uniref:hypothetical protein n=1 Tax=Acinetobacter baumannii TaxID=470 RepID=UPI001177B491
MSGPPTGVAVNKEVLDMFNNDFKITGAKSPKYDYITCMIADGEVVKAKCPLFGECENEDGLRKESKEPLAFQSMKKHLLAQRAGYGLYIFEWQEENGVRS